MGVMCSLLIASSVRSEDVQENVPVCEYVQSVNQFLDIQEDMNEQLLQTLEIISKDDTIKSEPLTAFKANQEKIRGTLVKMHKSIEGFHKIFKMNCGTDPQIVTKM